MGFFLNLGQARAIQLGISRSLSMQEPELHNTLRQGKNRLFKIL